MIRLPCGGVALPGPEPASSAMNRHFVLVVLFALATGCATQPAERGSVTSATPAKPAPSATPKPAPVAEAPVKEAAPTPVPPPKPEPVFI